MSSALSPYQRAVLQELGIPVWVDKDAAKIQSEPDISAEAQDKKVAPDKTDNRSRVAALRASLSGSEQSEKAPSDRPLSETERAEASSLLADISQSLNTLIQREPASEPQWSVGDECKVSAGSITFSVSPHLMTAKDKKALWSLMCQVRI